MFILIVNCETASLYFQHEFGDILRQISNSFILLNSVLFLHIHFIELKKTFQMFDRDSDGKISASELGHAFRVQGQNFSDAEIKQIIREIDEDGR